MNILYIGDVMGPAGIMAVERVLPGLRQELSLDIVIAQAENVTNGKGLSIVDYKRLQSTGVDGFSGGNWSTALVETATLLNDPNVAVVGPSNMFDCPGPGYKLISTPKGKVLLVSILGKIVGKDADKPTVNPLKNIDAVLDKLKDEPRVATVINFHGDYSSEKIVFGHYLDGRASLVVGDHWHIPTADAMLLPKGTGYQTDAGMCGSLDSSLGVKFEAIVTRWHDGIQNRNELETEGRIQFNAVLATIDEDTGLATDVQAIRKIW